MAEKNIFANELFFPLNISDFNFFWGKLQSPPEKSEPPLSQQLPSKSWGPVKPQPLFEILVRGSNPSEQKRGGRLHTMGYLRNFCCIFSLTPILLRRYFKSKRQIRQRLFDYLLWSQYKNNKWRFVLIRYSWMLKLVFLIVYIFIIT